LVAWHISKSTKTNEYWSLREFKRVGDKVKTETIKYFGDTAAMAKTLSEPTNEGGVSCVESSWTTATFATLAR